MEHEPWKYRYEKKYNTAFFWSSTKYDASDALVFVLHDRKKDAPFDYVSKNSTLSVRCIQNESSREPKDERIMPPVAVSKVLLRIRVTDKFIRLLRSEITLGWPKT